MLKGLHNRLRRRRRSPITRRILAVNLLALAILVAGLLYLGAYRQTLIAAELAALEAQAEMFAAAIGEGAVNAEGPAGQRLLHEVVNQMVRRLVKTTPTRARLFNAGGVLIADSRLLLGAGGIVQAEELPPPEAVAGEASGYLGQAAGVLLGAYDDLIDRMTGVDDIPLYHENAVQNAGDYREVLAALSGRENSMVRSAGHGSLLLSVAVPVQRYKQVLGALMLSKDSRQIEEALFQVRLDILKVFAVALAVTVALSFYLAGTIARPIHRLAEAAERIRHGHHRQHVIPDFSERGDEIGELAMTLADMTEALWQRMDAIERFAADVAHEIKNPLTSLNSAVETAARIEDAEYKGKLMGIIKKDVERLNRLISDISDASRLDAELSRAEQAPFDIGPMLATLADMHQAGKAGKAHPIALEIDDGATLVVDAMEGRLAQVFHNIVDNAVTFGPPGKPIIVKGRPEGAWIEIEIIDQGPGIPQGKEAAIFERFYSERPEGEEFGTHSGLGLSISKQIVEAHEGTITAENVTDGAGNTLGARFVVRLPAG